MNSTDSMMIVYCLILITIALGFIMWHLGDIAISLRVLAGR